MNSRSPIPASTIRITLVTGGGLDPQGQWNSVSFIVVVVPATTACDRPETGAGVVAVVWIDILMWLFVYVYVSVEAVVRMAVEPPAVEIYAPKRIFSMSRFNSRPAFAV